MDIFIVYQFFVSALPFLVVTLILFKVRNINLKNNKIYLFMLIIFLFYIVGVFFFTGIGTLYDINYYGVQINWSEINLVPFSRNIDIDGHLKNILLFIPFGIIIPMMYKKTDSFKYIISSSFLFSLLIEFSQLFNYRVTDIDDLILNTLGGIIGYILFKIFIAPINNKLKFLNYIEQTPWIYILAMFFGRFFLYNEFGLAS